MSSINELNTDYISSMINVLLDEYEALWLVDVNTHKMDILKTNSDISISGSVEAASTMTYEEANSWYISNYIVDDEKVRIKKETTFDVILRNLEKYNTYTVNYKRVRDDSINYNQLIYKKIDASISDKFLFGFRDIDRRRTAEIDGLSGLYNRQAFILHASRMLMDNPDKSFDFIMSDFVDFKGINEKYGSEVADRILECYGEYLLRISLDGLVISGRFGGDQFVQIIEHSLLEQKLLSWDPPNKAFKEDLPKVNIKYGIYRNVDHSLPIPVMFDRAHVAMETIKRNYGITVATYDNAIKDKIEKQRVIENCMSDALSDNQFRVFYQPKHDATTGKIVGAEALIRWVHPEYGFMSPGDFIPIFEKNGFVTEADKFVLDTTCKNIKKWQEKGINVIPISINASRSDFLNVDMIERFNSALNTNDLPKDLIHIEITESLMEENTEILIDTLTRLRNEGYQIELDDFGAGYSSINALSEFPIDVVKLDMSFMKQLDDEKRTKVLSSCINLAKNLGYKTISEGVETKRQEELLKEFGVDVIQGYFYSKPLSEDEFEKYMANIE